MLTQARAADEPCLARAADAFHPVKVRRPITKGLLDVVEGPADVVRKVAKEVVRLVNGRQKFKSRVQRVPWQDVLLEIGACHEV